MKKTLLTVLLSVPFLLMAQSASKDLKVPNEYAVQASEAVKAIDIQVPLGHTQGKSVDDSKLKKDKNFSAIDLGKTFYDLQTNSSPGRRIILHADGTISAVWTGSPDAGTGWPGRGTGYNYSDGTEWYASRADKIETEGRTGWPSIMLLDDGTEMVMAHESITGGFVASTNSSKGLVDFTSTSARLDDETVVNVNRVPIWNRSVASNDKVHTISNYWSGEAGGGTAVVKMGVKFPTTYSRWSVSGDTSEVEHMLLPGYDSSLYIQGGGDTYAIDARDSIIAILIGGFGHPVSLWKSTNNGQTWTYSDVDQLEYKGVVGAKAAIAATDTFNSNDGSIDVMIDNAGNVHAFWGLSRAIGSVNTDGDTIYSGFVASASLVHWTEGDMETKLLGGAIDRDGNGQFDVNNETFASLVDGNVPNNLLSAARVGNTNLITMPSASVDANGNLFVVYSAPVERAFHFLQANHRDIFVMYSTDGGANWSEPQNITQDGTMECNFPCVAKRSNDFLHVIYQEDTYPGTHLQNHSANAGSHPNDECTMKYVAIPITDILSDILGQDVITGVEDDKTAEVFVVSQNQPNPFRGTSDVIVYLRSNSNVTLTVTDILGNVVNQGDLGVLSGGNHTITLDANGLTSGMYFYTLTTEDHSVTKKMQVN
jgi:hypothetical protein